MSDAELGIVFAEIPAVEGDAADVYNSISTFEKEYWRTMTTNQVSPSFSILTSPEVLAVMQRVVVNNLEIQAEIGGVFRVTISGIRVDGDHASATTCDDYAGATFADASSTYTPEAAGFGEARLLEVTLARGASEGLWIIESEKWNGTC